MPPKTPTTATGDLSMFTAREQQILCNAFLCFETEPKIKMEKLAKLSGFGNIGSASNAWRAIKKKMGGPASDDNGTPTPKPSKTPRKRPTVDEDATPSKKTKTGKAAEGGKVKKEESNNDDDAAGSGAAVKKESSEYDGSDEDMAEEE